MNIKQLIKKVTDVRFREHKLYLGETENPTYVIRFFDREGLMSILFKSLGQIEYAIDKGYVPFVDMEHYANMYKQKGINAWECFFQQPIVEYGGGYSKKRILSACWGNLNSTDLFYSASGDIQKKFSRYKEKGAFFEQHIKVQNSILSTVSEIENEKQTGDCIGVLLRGTDYTSLKPKAHPIQPNVEEAIVKIDEFKSKYGGKIFIVTEDANIKAALQEKYGDDLIVLEDDYIANYQDGKMLSDCIDREQRIESGKKYLIKIILLSRCKYLIAGMTNGSLMALIMNKGQYEDSYVFDKGVY